MCSLLGELHVNIIGCCILIQSHMDETLTVVLTVQQCQTDANRCSGCFKVSVCEAWRAQ